MVRINGENFSVDIGRPVNNDIQKIPTKGLTYASNITNRSEFIWGILLTENNESVQDLLFLTLEPTNYNNQRISNDVDDDTKEKLWGNFINHLIYLVIGGVLNFKKAVLFRKDSIAFQKQPKNKKLMAGNTNHGGVKIGETTFKGKTYSLFMPYGTTSRDVANESLLQPSFANDRVKFPQKLLKRANYPILDYDSYLHVDEIIPVEDKYVKQRCSTLEVVEEDKKKLISLFAYLVVNEEVWGEKTKEKRRDVITVLVKF